MMTGALLLLIGLTDTLPIDVLPFFFAICSLLIVYVLLGEQTRKARQEKDGGSCWETEMDF
jgi:hypothetical protein